MSNFAQNYQHLCLLEISRRHREAVDPSRVRDGEVLGQDNVDNLEVSTVFAAVAIEAALNDYVLSHCLFVEIPYLQEVFGDLTAQFLRGSVQNKIDLLVKRWPDPIPKDLLRDVRELIRIRNRITHQTGEFRSASNTSDSRSVMAYRPLTADEMLHMLRHHEIARDFLSQFWLPGNRALRQGLGSIDVTDENAPTDQPCE